MYGLLADLIVLIHLLFILFVVFGALLVIRWSWVAWAHTPALIWGSATVFFRFVCPLTPLENYLRMQDTGVGYSSGFIHHYLVPIIYPGTLTPQIQWVLGSTLLLFNACLYYWIWRRRKAIP